MQLIVSYHGNGRECRRFIQTILYAKAASEIKRINYVHSYKVIDKKLTKNEEKMLIIFYNEEQKDKLDVMIKKGGEKVKIVMNNPL